MCDSSELYTSACTPQKKETTYMVLVPHRSCKLPNMETAAETHHAHSPSMSAPARCSVTMCQAKTIPCSICKPQPVKFPFEGMHLSYQSNFHSMVCIYRSPETMVSYMYGSDDNNSCAVEPVQPLVLSQRCLWSATCIRLQSNNNMRVPWPDDQPPDF